MVLKISGRRFRLQGNGWLSGEGRGGGYRLGFRHNWTLGGENCSKIVATSCPNWVIFRCFWTWNGKVGLIRWIMMTVLFRNPCSTRETVKGKSPETIKVVLMTVTDYCTRKTASRSTPNRVCLLHDDDVGDCNREGNGGKAPLGNRQIKCGDGTLSTYVVCTGSLWRSRRVFKMWTNHCKFFGSTPGSHEFTARLFVAKFNRMILRSLRPWDHDDA